jgi:hypothetical protein
LWLAERSRTIGVASHLEFRNFGIKPPLDVRPRRTASIHGIAAARIGMINREKRQLAKRLIESFAAARTTSDEYNDDFPSDRNDPALEAIFSNIWLFYSDYPHKLEGKHQLTPESSALFNRCALFLGIHARVRMAPNRMGWPEIWPDAACWPWPKNRPEV